MLNVQHSTLVSRSRQVFPRLNIFQHQHLSRINGRVDWEWNTFRIINEVPELKQVRSVESALFWKHITWRWPFNLIPYIWIQINWFNYSRVDVHHIQFFCMKTLQLNWSRRSLFTLFALTQCRRRFLTKHVHSPQQSRVKSIPIRRRVLFDCSISTSISFFVLCSLVTADVDDDTSELLSRPRWFSGDASFDSDCGSVGILTTTDFPFWAILNLVNKGNTFKTYQAYVFA